MTWSPACAGEQRKQKMERCDLLYHAPAHVQKNSNVGTAGFAARKPTEEKKRMDVFAWVATEQRWRDLANGLSGSVRSVSCFQIVQLQ